MSGLWQMAWLFIKLSITTFVGGVAMIPMLTGDLTHWFSPLQIQDMISVSLMTPGAFGSSIASFAGMMQFGVLGAIVCAAGVVVPSAALSTIVARWFYSFQKNKLVQGALSGVKPVVVGLIAATAFGMLLKSPFFAVAYKTVSDWAGLWAFLKSIDWCAILIFAAALVSFIKLKVDPVVVIVGCGVLGVVLYVVGPMVVG